MQLQSQAVHEPVGGSLTVVVATASTAIMATAAAMVAATAIAAVALAATNWQELCEQQDQQQ